MGNISSIEKLPSDVKSWLIRSIVNRTCSYDDLRSGLKDKGYVVSRSALGRFGKRMTDQFDAVRLLGPSATADEKSRIEQLRIRCLELARGESPGKRISVAEQYLAWVMKT
jgi:hypothetical protein